MRSDKETVFFKSLELAFRLSGQNYSENIENRIKEITYANLKEIDNNPSDELYAWVPAIAFAFFDEDYGKYNACGLNVESNETYVLFKPNAITNTAVISEIEDKIPCRTERNKYKYTKRLIARLYGGFPWFTAYMKACDELNLWDKEGVAYRIKCTGNNCCVNKLVQIKNEYRDSHKDETIIRKVENEEFRGIIHPFHTPNCIENIRHCKAIEDELE